MTYKMLALMLFIAFSIPVFFLTLLLMWAGSQ